MTFLLLLASIAVLEYIVRRPSRTRIPHPDARGPQSVEQPKIPAPASVTPGLYVLGEALSQFGKGESPGLQAQSQPLRTKSESR